MASAIDDCPVRVLVSLKRGWRSPLETYTLCLAWYRASTSREENANRQIISDSTRPRSPEVASGELAARPSFIPQEHGGALLGGGIPGHRGGNQHTVKRMAVGVRERLLKQLEGVVGDIEKVLAQARLQDGKQPQCKACGAFIPGTSRLNLKDLLMLLRELKGALPTQIEAEGRFQIGALVAGV